MGALHEHPDRLRGSADLARQGIEADALILRYLQELEAELHDLPANRRQELLDEVVARRLDPASAAAKLLEREL